MKFPRFIPSLILSAFFLPVASMLQAANNVPTDVTWIGADGGLYSTASNWSGGVAPGQTNRAVIGASSGTISLSATNPSADGLSLGAGSTLSRASGDTTNRTLTLQTITTPLYDVYFNNAGTIASGGTSGSLTLTFAINSSTSLAEFVNSGTIQASDGTTLTLAKSGNGTSSTTLTNTGGTVKTSGTGALMLSGANSGFGISGGSLTNDSGTLTLSTKGASTLSNVTFTNGGTANIREFSTTSSTGGGITLSGSTSLNNSSTLTLSRNTSFNSNASAKNITIASAVATTSITNSGTINIQTIGSATGTAGGAGFDFTSAEQTLANTGTINLESQSTLYDTFFSSTVTTGNGVTLTGTGGELVMKVGTGGSVDHIKLTGSNGIITQDTSHTIRGAGNIGAGQVKTFTNNGTVKADDATYALTIDPRDHTQLSTGVGSFINNGTVQATGAGGLVLNDGLYTNAGTFQITAASSLTQNAGVIFTNNSGKTLDIKGAWNSGAGGGGLIKNSGAISYDSSTSSANAIGITGSGTFTKDGSGSLTLNGANSLTGHITINAGTLVVGTGSGATFTATTSNGNYNVTTTDTTGLVVGQLITGTGIAANSYVTGILNGTTFTISNNASSTQASTSLTTNAYSTLGTGALTLNGGTLDLGAGSHTVGAVTFAGGTLSNGTLTGASYDARSGSISAILDGAVALAKTTSGTLTLSGSNTYSGGTTVSAGKLLVNNLTGSGTGSGTLSIGASATLGGSGIIGGATTIAGTLSPGNSPGILTFSNSVTLESGSFALIEINGSATRGTDFDGVNFNGGLTVNGGTLTFNISTVIADGATLNIFDGSALTASLTSVVATGSGGYSGSFTYNGSTAYTGTFGSQLVTFTLATGDLSFTAGAVPEPSAWTTLAGLAALLFVFARRHERACARSG